MSWKSGDIVVCVNPLPHPSNVLAKGVQYVIYRARTCCCTRLEFIGHIPSIKNATCGKCGARTNGFYADRFELYRPKVSLTVRSLPFKISKPEELYKGFDPSSGACNCPSCMRIRKQLRKQGHP